MFSRVNKYMLHRELHYVLRTLRFKYDWVQPSGFNTGIKVYNCVSRCKVPLVVKNKNLVTWYTCGPTVYDSAHIGHASCYVKLDIIQNILRNYFKLNLVTVMNITDIDDKIINKSRKCKIAPHKLAECYEKEFWADLKALNVSVPNIVLRVSENISVIQDFINKLINEGFAYKSYDNSVYFDLTNYLNYGKLQNIGQEEDLIDGPKVKRKSRDFALWKEFKPEEPYWDSPWGPGRPGWHIECSALASHALGPELDIHAGGIDLRFPHHENEEAQSCAYHSNVQWVNYWLHTGHLHLKDSEKMSKSLGNTITIQDMLQNTNVDVFRMACAMSHYRSGMEFSRELLTTAENVLTNYKNFVNSCNDFQRGILKASVNIEDLKALLEESVNEINEAFCNDFDTPNVLKILNNVVKKVNSMLYTSCSGKTTDYKHIASLSNLVRDILHIFKIRLEVISSDKSLNLTEVMDILNSFRQEVRQLALVDKNNNILNLCDNVRNDLKDIGIVIKDHGKLSSWSK